MTVVMRERISLLHRYISDISKQITLRKLIEEITPPIIARLIWLVRRLTVSYQGYSGVYSSFKECWKQNRELLSKSGSFNNPAFARLSLQNTKDALAKPFWSVKENCATVKLVSLLSLELGRKGSIKILDFGGGVGIHYALCQRYLRNPQIDYTVLDLPEVVSRGKEFFSDTKDIHFTDSMPSPKRTKFDMIILSSVLHYIDDYRKLLKDITSGYNPDILFLSRLPAGEIPDFVTMQTIPEASFPAHCFNYTKLRDFCLSLNYTVEDSWEEPESYELYDKERRYTIPHYKGMILRRIE